MLVGTWALAPSRPWGLAPQATAGSIASRDFVAPHDALVLDGEATAAKQQRTRDEVLPVYDFDPAAATRRWTSSSLFARLAPRVAQDLAEPSRRRSRPARQPRSSCT